jgi:single-strand DNA-binding protein
MMAEEIKHINAWLGAGCVYPSPSMPEGFTLKHLESGTAVLNINLLVEEKYQSRGEEKSRKTFIPLVAWGSEAEDFARQISKGSVIKVKGSYRNRAYEGRDGKRNYRHDFQIYNLEVLGQQEIQRREPPAERSETPPPALAQSSTATPPPAFAGSDAADEIPF